MIMRSRFPSFCRVAWKTGEQEFATMYVWIRSWWHGWLALWAELLSVKLCGFYGFAQASYYNYCYDYNTGTGEANSVSYLH